MVDEKVFGGLLMCVLAIVSHGVTASEAPSSREQRIDFPIIHASSDGEVVVHDPVHKFELRLPAEYWECKSPGQLAQESNGGREGGTGCSPGQGVPPSLLLVIRNRDAQAAASLELKSDRFRMRGRQDLEEYVDKRHNMVMKQGGENFTLQESDYSDRDGMIIHRASYNASRDSGTQRYVLVDYFVRPEGKEARVYQLACISTPEAYRRLKADFESIIGSFQYTGSLAESFFTPDAAPADLPDAGDEKDGPAYCGGRYSGMFIAMGLVFLIYMFFRGRSKK